MEVPMKDNGYMIFNMAKALNNGQKMVLLTKVNTKKVKNMVLVFLNG